MPSRFAEILARVFRIYFVILLCVVFLLVVVAVTHGPALLKNQAEQRLSSMLGADVMFKTFAVSPAGLFEVTGLTINGWPAAGTSFLFGRARARVDWPELLKQRPTIDQIEIENWVVTVRELSIQGSDRMQRAETAPMIELSSIELKNGMVMWGDGEGTWTASDINAEGLIRFDASQSTIRIRELDARLYDGFHCSAEATLWRLGRGAWELEVTFAGEDGLVAVTAKQLDDGWQWDVWAEQVELDRWVDAALGHQLGAKGNVSLVAGGVNLDGSGDVLIVDPGWKDWRADTLLVDFVSRRDALLGEHISLWNEGGRLHGTAGIVDEPTGLRIWSNILMDSLGIVLPVGETDPVTLSGELEGAATLSNGDVQYRLSMRDATASWDAWNLRGVDAAFSGLNEEVSVESLSATEGGIRGTVRGTVAPHGFALDQELMLSLPHVSDPFTDRQLLGVALCRGRISGTRAAVDWHGRVGLLEATVEGYDLGAAQFDGTVRLDERGVRASGKIGLFELQHAENSLLHFCMADIDVSPGRVVVEHGLFQLPNQMTILTDLALDDDVVRVEHLVGCSQLEAFSTVGDGRIRITGGPLELTDLRILTTEGGWCIANDLALDPFLSGGSLIVSDFGVGLATAAAGARDRYEGTIHSVIKGGRRNVGWMRIEGFQRLPAMRLYPVDIEVSATRTPRRFQVERLSLMQEDLHVKGRGFVDSTGILSLWAEVIDGSLPRVILLADELGSVGIREIFDAQEGTVTARLHAFGDATSPELEGELAVNGDAEVTVKPIRTTFMNMSGQARLSGHTLLIDDVVGEAARGTARMSGELRLPGFSLEGVDLAIEGRGQEFRILRGVYGIYDADITLKKRTLGIALEGEVRLLGGLINLPGLEVEPAPPTPASLDDRWQLTVTAARGVWARDRFLNAEVAGQIDVAKTEGFVTIQGELELLRGTYAYLGRKFNLQQGRVVFLGDPAINPELNITATTIVRSSLPEGEDVVLKLTVTGRSDNPELHVAAEGQQFYTEEQIKTMLLFNLTPEELESLWQGDSNEFAEEAAETMENLLVGELARAIRAETGLDELEVLPSLLAAEERDLYVRLGKYVTPELFISVGKGLRTMDLDELRVEYVLEELAERLGLGRRADLKLVGERRNDEYSKTTYEVLMKLKYRF